MATNQTTAKKLCMDYGGYLLASQRRRSLKNLMDTEILDWKIGSFL